MSSQLLSGLRVLLLEDDQRDAELIVHAVRAAVPDGMVRLVDTRPEFVRTLDEFVPDVILSDHAVADFNVLVILSGWRSAARPDLRSFLSPGCSNNGLPNAFRLVRQTSSPSQNSLAWGLRLPPRCRCGPHFEASPGANGRSCNCSPSAVPRAKSLWDSIYPSRPWKPTEPSS